jgi:hypothetical protein
MPMLSFDSLPQARVVRKGGQLFAPPPAPRTYEPSALRENLHNALAVMIGLWPLTAIVLLCAGFIIMAGNNGAP